MSENIEEVMLDLLCKKAVYGLTEQEEKQLAELQAKAGGKDRSSSFELTAAAIGMTGADASEELPASLRERIIADAKIHFDAQPDVRAFASTSPRLVDEPVRGSILNWVGWAVAAAACFALAINIYYTRSQNPIVQGGIPTPTPEERLTPAQLRQRLIDMAPDLARGSWGAGNVKGLSPAGDIVWSDARQAGYVRLSGVPKNDPSKETYQLWIVAENQDPKTPVDGGTFDIGADGEVIIPIDAKVKVQNPQAFAITMEKPGGVPVSKQDRVAAVAKRET